MFSTNTTVTSIRSRFILLAIALLCIGVFQEIRLWAQAQNTGTVAGNVVDLQHSAIPNARVLLRSEERGNQIVADSNGQGEFVLNDVPSGTYTLTVTAAGFQSFVAKHISVEADTRLRIDAEMKPGSVDTQVVVTADTAVVDTQSATVGAVLDQTMIDNMPIDGNNVVSLSALLPGVTDVNAPTTFTDENGGPSFSANGARGNSNLFLLDGMMWNNLFQNSGINYPPHAALQEVSVRLNNFTAQYGRNAGSIYNSITRSGTNQIHGQVWEYLQNSALNSSDYFTKANPFLVQNQFGATVGGPVIKNKIFYFLAFQNLRASQQITAQAQTLTLHERGLSSDGVTPLPCSSLGPFSGMNCASFAEDASTSSAISSVVENPLYVTTGHSYVSTVTSQLNSTYAAQGGSGTSPCLSLLQTKLGSTHYVSTAEIPSTCFDPTIQNFLQHNYMPLPTLVEGSGMPYAISQRARPRSDYNGFARVDWMASSRHTLDFRYYRTHSSDITANGATSNTGVATYEPDFNIADINFGEMSDTWVVTQHIVNVIRTGYKRYEYGIIPRDTTALSKFGAIYSAPGNPSLPTMNVNTRVMLGASNTSWSHSVNENMEASDYASYAKSTHNLEFGADWLHMQYLNYRDNPGTFNFYQTYTNNPAADFMMGLLYSEQVGNRKEISGIQNALYLYAQDTWRAMSRLTVDCGIRYELPWMWYQPKGYAATFIRGYQSTKFPNAPANLAFVGDRGVSRSLVNTDYTNVSPRVGLAYDVSGNGRTAIRAGFGTFYDAIPALVVGASQPFTYSANYTYPLGSITNPLYGARAIPANVDPHNPLFTGPYSIVFPDKNFKTPMVFGFNIGVQHQLNKGTTLELNYIGRLGRHMTMPFDMNPAIRDCSGAYYIANPDLYCHTPASATITSSGTYAYANRVVFPGYNYGGQGVVDYATVGTSNYNALQFIYRQSAFHRLTVLATYTYSRSLDMQSNTNTSNATPTPGNLRLQYGPSDQNATQIFNLGWHLKLPNLSQGDSLVKTVLNDWSFNGIYNARTGHPVNITFGGDEATTDEPNQRPLLLGDPKLPSNRHRVAKTSEWFNNAGCDLNTTGGIAPAGCMWAKPLAGNYGNIGRNAMIGPAYIMTTFSLMKNISLSRLRQGMRMQFRTEAYNVFNTPNLAQPHSQLNTTATQQSLHYLGTIDATVGQNSTVGTNGRRVQAGLVVYY